MPRGKYKRKSKGPKVILANHTKEGWEIAQAEEVKAKKPDAFPYENVSKIKRIELLLKDVLELKDQAQSSFDQYSKNSEELYALQKRCRRYEHIIDKLTER